MLEWITNGSTLWMIMMIMIIRIIIFFFEFKVLKYIVIIFYMKLILLFLKDYFKMKILTQNVFLIKILGVFDTRPKKITDA